MQSLCLELQLEESVDELMQQLGADDQGHVSYAQFLLCHKNLHLTPQYQDPMDALTNTQVDDDKVFRRREPKNGSGKRRVIPFPFLLFMLHCMGRS